MSFIEPGQFDMIVRLRGRGISDTNVLRAMEQVPRSAFVALDLRMKSYDEIPLPIACGQTMLSPLDTAIILQSLDVKPQHKVLLIGSGSGYMAALLGRLSTRVYGIERYRELAETGEKTCRSYVNNVVTKHGDGRLGWRGQAPFDRIVLTLSNRVMPTALVEQLKTDGKILGGIDDWLVVGQHKTGWKERQILPMKLPPLIPGKSKVL